MASRLSGESIVEVLETGHQGLAVEAGHAFELLAESPVDLDRLLEEEDPEAAIQAIEPYRLYQALVTRGPEDALDVLPHLSTEQVTRILDYEAWREDRLEPYQLMRWLKLFREVGPEELIKRYRGMDEEMQIAFLSPYIEVVDGETYEDLSPGEQDSLQALPGSTLYYKIKSEDPRLLEFITDLIDAGLAVDLEYLQSMLMHAALLPPNEQEALLQQFRRARIEEDGFVSFAESMTSFQRMNLAALRKKWPLVTKSNTVHDLSALAAAAYHGDSTVLERAMRLATTRLDTDSFNQLTRSFAMLANNLTAAARIDADDHVGLRRLLTYGQSFVSLALDWLSAGDAERAALILLQEHPKALFRTGLSLIYALQDETMQRLVEFNLPDVRSLERNFKLDRRGLLLHQMDLRWQTAFGFARVETFKGLFNRYPVRPKRIIPQQDHVQRVIFTHINSLADYNKLALAGDTILGLLYLAGIACKQNMSATDFDLDECLSAAIMRALVSGEFCSRTLSTEEKTQFSQISIENLQTRIPAFLQSMEQTLQRSVLQWSARATLSNSLLVTLDEDEHLHDDLAANRSPVKYSTKDSVQVVLAELAELLSLLLHSQNHAQKDLPPFINPLSTSTISLKETSKQGQKYD